MIKKKQTPLTPSFPVEKDNDEYIRKVINESFDKSLGIKDTVPKEIGKDTMSVGVSSVNKSITFYWRPNNYRLQIPFDRTNFNLGVETTPLIENRKGSVIKTKYGKVKISNFGSKINFEVEDIPVMIDKKSITITYSLKSAISPTKMEKAVYKIEADNIEDIHKRIDERVESIRQRCLKIAKKVVECYGGKAEYDKAIWIRHEDAIHKEDWVPEESVIYDTHFKKVYPTQIEMKSPAFIKNFYSNRVVEEIAPQIAKELSKGNNSIKELENTIVSLLNPAVERLTEQIVLHLDVEKGAKDVQAETLKTLEEMRKPFFVRWWNYFKKLLN